MTVDRLKEAIRSEPFRAFRLHMGSRRAIEVRHPELISISPSGRTAVVFGKNDAHEIVDVFLIQSVGPLKHGARSGRRKSA
ncbi:MAG: hypothetical protein IT435_13875 [Phycisphaerales bacterium]|nr:hypothetical protein [Phycisphaerales bacterium]